MNEDDKARPVSGEIMAHGAPSRDRARVEAFSDAEYETVGIAREAAAPRFQPATPANGMDFLKDNARSAEHATRSGGALFWMTGLTLVVLAFWVSGGHALVRSSVLSVVGEAAQPLRIVGVTSRIERHDGRDILFVEGHAENGSAQSRSLPPIEIAVFASDGTNTRYFLGTNDAELKPGDRYAFSSRLDAPTNGVKTVSVTFQEGNR